MCGQPISIKNNLRLANTQLIASESCHLDCEVILAYVLNKNRSYLRAWPEKILSQEQQQRFECLVKQRLSGKPIAYIMGEREFWSRLFYVTPEVLIPRPDTELLIEVVLATLQHDLPLHIADLGTGSGIIAICLALEYPNANITAIDKSKTALSIAKKNAQRHQCTNITFSQGNWLEKTPKTLFDIIISNPPYIDSADEHLSVGDVQFEPKSALVSARKGMQDIEVITVQAKSFLKPKGFLLLEHGYQQSNDVKTLLELRGYSHIKQFKDIQGHLRATLCQLIQP